MARIYKKNELKKTYTWLKNEILEDLKGRGIEINVPATRTLTTISEVENAIYGLIITYSDINNQSYMQQIRELRSENLKRVKENQLLEEKIEKLKNKKWWQIWK